MEGKNQWHAMPKKHPFTLFCLVIIYCVKQAVLHGQIAGRNESSFHVTPLRFPPPPKPPLDLPFPLSIPRALRPGNQWTSIHERVNWLE